MKGSQRVAEVLTDRNLEVATLSDVVEQMDRESVNVDRLAEKELGDVMEGGVRGACLHAMLGINLNTEIPLSVSIDPRLLVSMVREIQQHGASVLGGG